jgi:hypothetical protein
MNAQEIAMDGPKDAVLQKLSASAVSKKEQV